MRVVCTLLSILFFTSLYAQNKSSYLFIEPNVSLSYDNALLKVKDSFSNAIYGTEAYGFYISIPNRTRSQVQISTSLSAAKPDQKFQDSLYKALINQINRYAGDSITIKSKKPVSYKGFIGLAYIGMHKTKKEYGIGFSCRKYFEGAVCEVYYSSNGKQVIDSLSNDYAVLTSLIDGIQTYSRNDFEKEDSLLQHKYTIVVDSITLPGGIPEATFTGIISVKEKLEHPVKGAKLDYQVFSPDYRGHVIIYCSDPDKGRIEKKGELIVLNKIGKKVKIPFSFTYYNK